MGKRKIAKNKITIYLVLNKNQFFSKSPHPALAGVAQRIERWPANQRVTGSIPSQGTCLGCRPGPQGGVVRGNHTVIETMFLSLSFSFPSPLSRNK